MRNLVGIKWLFKATIFNKNLLFHFMLNRNELTLTLNNKELEEVERLLTRISVHGLRIYFSSTSHIT